MGILGTFHLTPNKHRPSGTRSLPNHQNRNISKPIVQQSAIPAVCPIHIRLLQGPSRPGFKDQGRRTVTKQTALSANTLLGCNSVNLCRKYSLVHSTIPITVIRRTRTSPVTVDQTVQQVNEDLRQLHAKIFSAALPRTEGLEASGEPKSLSRNKSSLWLFVCNHCPSLSVLPSRELRA